MSARAAPSLCPPTPALRAAVDAFPGGRLAIFAAAAENRVFMAMHVRASPDEIKRRLLDPRSYRRAVPSFESADVVARRARPDRQPADTLIDWELEIPLWNLDGRLWLKSFPDAVQIALVEGAFSPGRFTWRLLPHAGGTILTLEGTANTRDANFATRRLAKRSPLAEPAMTVAAALVLLEAMALDVTGDERARATRWPATPPAAPSPETGLSATGLLHMVPALAAQSGAHAVAMVTIAPGGRLAFAQVATRTSPTPAVAMARVFEGSRWKALPGWKQIEDVTASGPGRTGTRSSWDVDVSFPFIDFDARWDVVNHRCRNGVPSPCFFARAGDGDVNGAVMAWDAYAPPGPSPQTWVAFTMHPNLHRTGYVPRKFIEKEPLLEHGLSLALTYVNGVTLAGALGP